ncbi:TonB family protein [Roseovarius sp. ZX-A-9]|uniref:TonB family protein n=1 Tax=Roseovarius sp. ZX-A-9 TaxID=3014783 RepID=UPI00232EFEC3|nr:TonB family protein [Roseovarius sp. ZX-A-9]
MIARSRLVFSVVLLASSALHLGAMTLIWSEPSVRLEGGAQVAETSLGSSFADLAQGVQQPTEAVQEVTQPVKSAALTPAKPTVQEVAQPAKPATVAPSRPSDVLTSEAVSQSSPTVATAISPASSTDVIAASRATDRVNPEMAPSPTEQEAAPTKTTAQPVPAETVVAAMPEAPTASVRPKMRAEKRSDPPQAKPVAKPAKPKGNASRNAKAGAQTGKAAKPSQTSQPGKAKTRKAEGNAAASNYPGQVMRRLSRVPRPRSSVRGVAVVKFTIAGNGQLANATIARSSGSAALDRAALAMVRKAQPFPPPPSGARRNYTINIKGK